MIEIKLPPLAEGVDKATVTYCHKSAGDSVNEGEDLIELVTDKATFNMPSPATGVLKEVLVSEGDEVKVGQVVAKIG
ncbi:MAG: lipoyl domain-containing protein [Candidatus Omnitrophica bacterium]|nr:lipoyl domain-containing protein [Candidatus Omnitrophota bacterium]MBU0880965.1 lipoyl domain-containing protein [Candidatus Omnitrophota bacterium]MBU1037956.1 lipoyl domain-containing protein [Candidatus Omnitrophota bacterium]MBU1808313.1 lipoyl domain-containing protein [Candidatus Omnitrophota bacterium]